MSTLKDVEFSRRGEQGKAQSANQLSDFLAIADQGGAPTVSSDKEEFFIFKLVSNVRKGGVYIPNTDDVFNPASGRVERIRLLLGVESIWMKDQKDLTPEFIRTARRNLHFPRGAKILRISSKDGAALEFARLCKHNIKDPKKKTGSLFEYYEYDAQKQQKEALEREEFEIEMAIAAKSQTEEKMRKHAAYLRINLFDDFGMPKTADGIRREYIIYAKRNPAKFKESLESKEVEVFALVKRAISDSKIDLGSNDGAIRWANGAVITKIPDRADPYQYLTDLAMQSSAEGKEFLKRLQEVVK